MCKKEMVEKIAKKIWKYGIIFNLNSNVYDKQGEAHKIESLCFDTHGDIIVGLDNWDEIPIENITRNELDAIFEELENY